MFLDPFLTVESESEKSQNYKLTEHAEKATPISDRGKIMKIPKFSFICIIIVVSDVFLAEKSIPWVLVTLICIYNDIGLNLRPHPYTTTGKFMKILKSFISHDYCRL